MVNETKVKLKNWSANLKLFLLKFNTKSTSGHVKENPWVSLECKWHIEKWKIDSARRGMLNKGKFFLEIENKNKILTATIAKWSEYKAVRS